MTKRPLMVPLTGNYGNKPRFHPISDLAKIGIERAISRKLPRSKWTAIEKTLEKFAERKWRESQWVTQKEFIKRLRDFIRGANLIQGALQDVSSGKRDLPIGRDIWSQIWGEEFTGKSLAKFSRALYDLSVKASHEMVYVERLAVKKLSIDPWYALVAELTATFETPEHLATAANSSRAKNPKPSEFVVFVGSLVMLLPVELRVHVHSHQAMTKAIQRELLKIRQKKRDRPAKNK